MEGDSERRAGGGARGRKEEGMPSLYVAFSLSSPLAELLTTLLLLLLVVVVPFSLSLLSLLVVEEEREGRKSAEVACRVFQWMYVPFSPIKCESR